MRFNKWPFRRFSLSQLFIDIRNNSNKSFVCPLTSGGETSTHCRARAAEQNVLSAPLLSSLPGVHSGALRSAECALHGSLSGCSGRPRVRRSSQLGLVWVRLQRDGASGRKDHRPITFSKKRWANLPPGHQCPHTCRPRLLDLPKSFGQQRLQVVGRPDCSGVSPFWRLGPEMVGRWVPVARPHTAFTNHRSHTSLDRRWPGGEEGAGQIFQDPEMDPGQSRVLRTVSLTPLVEKCCIVVDFVVTNQE